VTRIIQEVNVMEEDSRIYVLTEFTIAPGKVDAFKEIAQELLAVVKEKESETLRYLCYFDKDQSKSYLVEEYPNAAALRAHIVHVGIILPKLLKISKPKFTVLGKPNLVAKEILSSFEGAQNFTYWNGLAR
jgi:quinol monooxygenase YgiN